MSLSTWRDIAIVILTIEVFLVSLLPLVILIFISKGLRSLLKVLPAYGRKGREMAKEGETLSKKVSQHVAAPFIWSSSVAATIKCLFSRQCWQAQFHNREES